MARHKYKVGQRVSFSPGRTSMAASGRDYKVIQLLPEQNGQNQYRIKSIAETHERMAIETELAAF
jgi:hypothetical protein